MLQSQLIQRWLDVGIREGDVVLLHSSISRTMKNCQLEESSFGVADLLESFVSTVGSKGTLVLPLFNFSFCDGQPFIRSATPSSMGALSEVARQDKRFIRTTHPVYSFAVFGLKTDEFLALNNVSAFADDGPFGLLRRLDGKIAVLDLDDQNSMTFYHHVEEVMRVNYRYHKSFTGTYIDFDECPTERIYELFVWDELQQVQTDVNRAGELLWENGLYSGDRPLIDSGMRVIHAKKMFDAIAQLIRDGRAEQFLFSIKKDIDYEH